MTYSVFIIILLFKNENAVTFKINGLSIYFDCLRYVIRHKQSLYSRRNHRKPNRETFEAWPCDILQII